MRTLRLSFLTVLLFAAVAVPVTALAQEATSDGATDTATSRTLTQVEAADIDTGSSKSDLALILALAAIALLGTYALWDRHQRTVGQ